MTVQSVKNALHEQLLKEVEAMTKYALSSGLKLPGKVVQLLDSLDQPQPDSPADAGQAAQPDSSAGLQSNLQKLSEIHDQLSELIAPAKPKTILLMSSESHKYPFLRIFGPVPLVRGLMLVAVASLAMMLLISQFPEVDGKVDWANQHGMTLMLNELFLLSASAIGASFIALFNAQKYITEGTFDPKYDYSYWVRLFLGLIAGTILALLIPIQDTLGLMTKPTLAMLGGFSVTVVYRILNRLVVTVETMVQGDSKEMVASQVQSAKAMADQANARNKLKLAAQLMSMKQQMGPDLDQEKLKQKLDQLLEEMIPLDQQPGAGG